MNKNDEDAKFNIDNAILNNLKQEDSKLESEKNSFLSYEERIYNSEFYNLYEFPIKIPGEITPECFTVRFDKFDNYVAGGYSNGYICVYNIETGEAKLMKGSDYPITCLRWKNSPDQKSKNILVSVSADGKITHWHTYSGKTLHTMEEKDNPIMCLDFSPDGTLFATGGTDKKVRLYDDNTKTLLKIMKPGDFNHPGHSNRIFSINFHKENSNLLASGGWDNTIQFYDVREGTIVRSIYGPHVCGDAIDMKGDYILTGSWSTENQIQIWDIRTFKLVYNVNWEKEKAYNPTYLYSAQFSKNSKSNLFAVGGSNSNIFRIFENETSQKLPQATSKFMNSSCYSIDFGNISNYVSIGCGDGGIRVYSVNRNPNE